MLFRVQKDFAIQIFKKKLSKQLLIIEDCINDYGDKQYLIEKYFNSYFISFYLYCINPIHIVNTVQLSINRMFMRN